MALVIGLGIRSIKYAHKSYKKHQAEKELRARGTHPEIPDQYPESMMLGGPSIPAASQRSSSPRIPDRSLKPTTLNRHHRSSSSSSVSSASTAEAEAQLENDVEFQRFIAQQKQLYLDQRRLTRGYDSGNQAVSSDPYSNSMSHQPPAYEVAVAQSTTSGNSLHRTNTDNQRQSWTRTPPQMVHPVVAELSDEETYIVSPVTPISASRPRSGTSFSGRDSDTVSNIASSPVGVVCELPAAPHASSARFPVELPSAVV